MDLISSNKITSPFIKIFWITVGWTLVALFKFLSGYITIIDTKFQCEFAGLDIILYLKSTLIAGVAGSGHDWRQCCGICMGKMVKD